MGSRWESTREGFNDVYDDDGVGEVDVTAVVDALVFVGVDELKHELAVHYKGVFVTR